MRPGRIVLIVIAAFVVGALMLTVARIGAARVSADERQDALQPFYDAPDALPEAGTLIRSEPLGIDVPGGSAFRVLFSSERPDGTLAASSGMVFVPTGTAPAEGRPILAFAHGTIGMGSACAPSRSTDPTQQLDTWLSIALERGWVVVAPDYTGLGTEGPNLYLVGEAEARDVVNAVRSARELPDAGAGTDWVVSGHSQGGHAALWTGTLAPELAPDLDLVGVAAIAPSAELSDIIGAQWQGRVGWVIGPEAVESWTAAYPDLSTDGVLTEDAAAMSADIVEECIVEAALRSLGREKFNGSFFERNPLEDPAWRTVIEEQTPAPLPADLPMMLFQSTADTVVLAWPNAILQEQWCAAGSNMDVTWVGDVSHNDTGLVAGPDVVTWAEQRFGGTAQVPNCSARPAAPASAP